MQSLTLYFEENAVSVGPLGQRMLHMLGGLDLCRPEKWGRYGMNICEDYIGYPVLVPRPITATELYEVIAEEVGNLRLQPVIPADESNESLMFAVNQMVRAISGANGKPLSDLEYTEMDGLESNTPEMMFLAVLNNLSDGTEVQNYSIRLQA